MKDAALAGLVEAKSANRPAALVTDLESGEQILLDGDHQEGALALSEDELATVRARLAEDRSGPIDSPGRRLFVLAVSPPLRLVIVGAVHIAQSLVPMASLAGYAVTVIDPRRAFATDARFPDVTLLSDWPDEAMEALAPDTRTAIVTLTHDPKLDDPALQVALRSPAFYIGALGSRRTHASRLQRLRDAGLAETALARIHGPAGLDIGARSPAEIAVSVLAELTAVRHHSTAARGRHQPEAA